MSESPSGRTFFWITAATAMAVDQISKWLFYEKLLSGRDISVIPNFLHLSGSQNTGVVWGLFGRWPEVVALVGIAAAAFVVFFYYRYCSGTLLEAFAWGAVLGGAVGNLIDRMYFGHVRDFIDVFVAGWHWPTFNVADICISIAAVALVLRYFFMEERKKS